MYTTSSRVAGSQWAKTSLCWLGSPSSNLSRPGAFLERREYSGQFHVYLFPEGRPEATVRAPAFVYSWREKGSREGQGGTGGEGYQVYNLRWAEVGGKRVTFERSPNSLMLHRGIIVEDDGGRKWTVILTDEKVK